MITATAIPSTMRASVLVAQGDVRLEERPVPSPADDEVLFRVAPVGVCGSDVHHHRNGRIGDFVVDAPLVLGHEVSGRIVAVGNEVPDTRIGERVIRSRELSVTGVFRYTDTWPLAAHLVATGQVDLDPLITGHFDLDHAEDALDADQTPGSLKSIVTL